MSEVSPEVRVAINNLFKVPTKVLIEELYNRVDDNLYAPEKSYAPFLDYVERVEKQNLYQILKGVHEDYADVEEDR